MIATKSGADLTDAMITYAGQRLRELAEKGLSGYILKRASPSCGMARVKVHTEDGVPGRAGSGLFARALMDAFPLLPVEEEGRLTDLHLRDNFITRVFSYRRLTALRDSAPRPADLVAFHTAHKYLLLAHSPAQYVKLGASWPISSAFHERSGSSAMARASWKRSGPRPPPASTSTCSSTSWASSRTT
jgi:hypothetical protein